MKGIIVKKIIFCHLVLMFLTVFSLSGCVYLIVGGVGAVGGYIVSPDTVEGLTDHDDQTVWDAAEDIVSIMGIILTQQRSAGMIEAKISGARVIITVVPINSSTVKLSVKARKSLLPRISIAQDVFVKIMSELNGDLGQ